MLASSSLASKSRLGAKGNFCALLSSSGRKFREGHDLSNSRLDLLEDCSFVGDFIKLLELIRCRRSRPPVVEGHLGKDFLSLEEDSGATLLFDIDLVIEDCRLLSLVER